MISPLLANIALHGMEEAIGFTPLKYPNKRAIVRYADYFCVLCESKQDAEATQHDLSEWLIMRGLTFSTEKTRIVHLSEGFDFLGMNIRVFKTKKKKSGLVLLIRPSKKSVNKIREKLRVMWTTLSGSSVDTVIDTLNPIIRGWANYHRREVASRTFSSLDKWMRCRENLDRNDNWVFGERQTGKHLLKFAWFKIERHVLVRGTASPDDPKLTTYWKSRTEKLSPELAPSWQKIAKNQHYKCPICGQTLFNDEELHKHHIQARHSGGPDTYRNYLLLHLYCHQKITSQQQNSK